MTSPGNANFTRVPVYNIHKENINALKDRMVEDIKDCDFLAIDCELSGLGDRKKLKAPSIDDRYKNTCIVAKTRSIISLGLSLFKLVPNSDETNVAHWSYSVKTYNLLVLCNEDYIVEPASLQFLVQHGFDFNSQYKLGIGYNRGNDIPEEEEKGKKQEVREIFAEIVKAKKPLVLHNGLIDLVFLYHNFWCALPTLLGTFTCDITEMFPCGIYDTKYIAEFVSRTQATYLEFVFRKEQKTNAEKFKLNRPHVKLIFNSMEFEENIDWRICALEKETEAIENDICQSYANHGHCPVGNDCKLSHNIDSILKMKTEEQEKKRRKRKHEPEETESITLVAKGKEEENGFHEQNSCGHRAGYDAFMTAFSFSTFLVHQTQLPPKPDTFQPSGIKAEKLANRVYLVSKDFPLLLHKSNFAKCSVEHDAKMRRLNLRSSVE